MIMHHTYVSHLIALNTTHDSVFDYKNDSLKYAIYHVLQLAAIEWPNLFFFQCRCGKSSHNINIFLQISHDFHTS